MKVYRQDYAGFTIVELLVVISIITLLAALLAPALRQVKEQGQRIQCMNNLRQIGLALHTYANENRDYPPIADDFSASPPAFSGWGMGNAAIYAPNQLAYYVKAGLFPRYIADKRVLYCPAQKRYTSNGVPEGWDAYLGYLFFCNLQNPNAHWEPIGDPDGNRTSGDGLSAKSPSDNPGAALAECMGNRWGNDTVSHSHVPRTFFGMNRLYNDGHVRWLSDDHGSGQFFIFYQAGPGWVW